MPHNMTLNEHKVEGNPPQVGRGVPLPGDGIWLEDFENVYLQDNVHPCPVSEKELVCLWTKRTHDLIWHRYDCAHHANRACHT